jgi:hypothetical protein
MGLASHGLQKARTRQRDAIITEAAKAGSRAVNVTSIGNDPSVGDALGSMAKAFVGGTVSSDDSQVFTLDCQGFAHVYVQPYDGLNAMPGWHFATLPGSVPHAAVLRAFPLGRRGWVDRKDQPIDGLNSHPVVSSSVRSLEWNWRTGMVEIKLPWAIQMRPTGIGTTEIAMRAGRYGGVSTYGVGVAVFLQVARAIHTLTSTAPIDSEPFIAPIGNQA